jgi:hypothetical protein
MTKICTFWDKDINGICYYCGTGLFMNSPCMSCFNAEYFMLNKMENCEPITEEEKKELAVYIKDLFYVKRVISWKRKTELLEILLANK